MSLYSNKIFTNSLLNDRFTNITQDIDDAINKIAKRLDDPYDHRPLTQNHRDQILMIIQEEINRRIPLEEPLPAKDKIVDDLKRSVLNFKLVE